MPRDPTRSTIHVFLLVYGCLEIDQSGLKSRFLVQASDRAPCAFRSIVAPILGRSVISAATVIIPRNSRQGEGCAAPNPGGSPWQRNMLAKYIITLLWVVDRTNYSVVPFIRWTLVVYAISPIALKVSNVGTRDLTGVAAGIGTINLHERLSVSTAALPSGHRRLRSSRIVQ